MFSCHVIGLQIKDVAVIEHKGPDCVAETRSELRVVAKEENDFDLSINHVWRQQTEKKTKNRTPSFDFVAVLRVQLSVMLWWLEKSLFYSALVSFSNMLNQWTDSGGKKWTQLVNQWRNPWISPCLWFGPLVSWCGQMCVCVWSV